MEWHLLYVVTHFSLYIFPCKVIQLHPYSLPGMLSLTVVSRIRTIELPSYRHDAQRIQSLWRLKLHAPTKMQPRSI